MSASPFVLAGCAVAGLVVGSFVTTAALRSVRGEQAVFGRSRCDSCGAGLGLAATAPVLSYLVRAGGCAHCAARIDPWHPAGEVAGALILVAAALATPDPMRAVLIAVLGLALLASAVVDARSRRLPDPMTALIALLALGLAVEGGSAAVGLAAGAVVFLVMEGLRRTFLAIRGKPGLGFGDVKLIAALSVWLGLATPWAIVVASLLGLIGFTLVRPADGRLAFGPAIAAGGFLVGLAAESGMPMGQGLFG